MLTLSEIKNASLNDLQKALNEARMKHHAATMAVRTQQSKSTHEPKLIKRYIARLLQQIGTLSKAATAEPEVKEAPKKEEPKAEAKAA